MALCPVSQLPSLRGSLLAGVLVACASPAPQTVIIAPDPQAATIAPAPDMVLTHGKVFTSDPGRLWAEAVAIRGDRIVAVGTTAEIERLAGPATRRIPVGGRTVVPGFDDAHTHAGPSGMPGVRFVVDPSPTPDPSLQSVLDSLGQVARRAPAGRWIITSVGGRVFDDPRAGRAVLDSVAPAHPVILDGWSGHGAVLNTAGLRAAGLLDAPDPLGGWLVRDPAGVPLGRIDEYASYGTKRRLATARGDSVLAASLGAYGRAGFRLGITSVQDMTSQYDGPTLRAALGRGEGMLARHRVIRMPSTMSPGGWRADWLVWGADTALSPTTHVSGVKWILDGTPIERLALMREPYADRPGWRGRANFPFDTLRAILRDALARRHQPMFHAVGDSTIALLIAAMRAEAPDSAWRRLRPRLEHGDGLGRDQLADMRSLGFVVVQNPSHLAIPDVVSARWGTERLSRIEPLRTLVDSGIPLAIGSDGPRAPGLNIMFATLHPNVPAEALTREQAVVAYTRGSAYAAFAEHERGTLAPGMLADIAVLSQDVFTVPPNALPATTSVLTLLGGRVVHDAMVATSAGFTSDRIDVVTRGTGPDVILIPGLATHRDVWNGVADQLDDRYRLHLVQVRGFAGVPAGANAEGAVAAPVADEIARYIRESRLQRPAVIGHSMGGTIGMMVAARHPPAVGRLMVVDMPSFMGVMFGSPGATVDSVRPAADQIRARILAEDPGSPTSMLQQMFSGMTASDSMRAVLLRNVRDSDSRTMANAFHELIVTDLREELRRVTVPLTVMYAIPKNAPVSSGQFESGMRASFANAPHARIIRIDDSNHFIQIDQAARFVSAVDDFMR